MAPRPPSRRSAREAERRRDRGDRREAREPGEERAGLSLMRQEIAQQPEALRATISALLPRRDEVSRLAADTKTVLFIARGTSDNAAVYGSYLVQAYAGRLAALAAPSIATTYRARIDLTGVLAVALSQSGRTEEIVETLEWAGSCGARTLAVTNGGAASPLAEAAEVAFVTEAGIEQAVPATKTFTTQLAALAVLSLGLGAALDPGELMAAPDAIEELLAAWHAGRAGADRQRAGEGGRRRGVRPRYGLCRRAGAGDQAEGGMLPACHGPVLRRPAARPDRRGGRGYAGHRAGGRLRADSGWHC